MDGKNDMHTTYLSYLTTYLTSTLHKDQQQEKNNNNIYNNCNYNPPEIATYE